MSQFIQLHLLTSYAPANLNRDDLGRPKTALMGGADRLRVSSQSLKRNWRVSDLFEEAMAGHIGTRTKKLGVMAYDSLLDAGVNEKQAKTWASSIADVFGKAKKDNSLEIQQLVHVSETELQAVMNLVATLAEEQREPTDAELELMRAERMSVDIALFGRMLASEPAYNVEAACQVAHAISVHKVVVEEDFFTAVDDLNKSNGDTGSAHLGEANFAAALFYSYICINKSQLIENLGGNEALAEQAIKALTEAAVKVSPKGKQNSYASRAYASYVLAEKGTQQPRSLSVAYLKPISDEDQATAAIQAIEEQTRNFDAVYGECADTRYCINALEGKGSLAELLDFVAC